MRPKRILLLRHGEAEGNVDDSLFETRPDHTMGLTERGRSQAKAAGLRIREIVQGGQLGAYVSPYSRTRETFTGLEIPDLILRACEEPRLREQESGNLWDRKSILAQKSIRDDFGHFFYRYVHGESGADVFDRVSSFLETLFRDFERPNCPPNILIVTHGMTMRLFAMRWFHWTVEYFESLDNPSFCEIKTLTDGASGYELDRPFEQWKDAPIKRAGWPSP